MEGQKIQQILRDFQQINFVRIFVILVVAWLLAKAVELFFPWLASGSPAVCAFTFSPRCRFFV
jgi:hypothetical protein